MIAQRTELSWQGRVEKRERELANGIPAQRANKVRVLWGIPCKERERKSRLTVEMQIMICRYGVKQ